MLGKWQKWGNFADELVWREAFDILRAASNGW